MLGLRGYQLSDLDRPEARAALLEPEAIARELHGAAPGAG